MLLNASLRTRLALTRGSQTSHMPKGRHRERFASSFQKNFATQRFSLLNLTCRLLTRTRLALTRGSELSRTRERDADGDAFFECVRDRVRACVSRIVSHVSLSFMSFGPNSHSFKIFSKTRLALTRGSHASRERPGMTNQVSERAHTHMRFDCNVHYSVEHLPVSYRYGPFF